MKATALSTAAATAIEDEIADENPTTKKEAKKIKVERWDWSLGNVDNKIRDVGWLG